MEFSSLHQLRLIEFISQIHFFFLISDVNHLLAMGGIGGRGTNMCGGDGSLGRIHIKSSTMYGRIDRKYGILSRSWRKDKVKVNSKLDHYVYSLVISKVFSFFVCFFVYIYVADLYSSLKNLIYNSTILLILHYLTKCLFFIDPEPKVLFLSW